MQTERCDHGTPLNELCEKCDCCEVCGEELDAQSFCPECDYDEDGDVATDDTCEVCGGDGIGLDGFGECSQCGEE